MATHKEMKSPSENVPKLHTEWQSSSYTGGPSARRPSEEAKPTPAQQRARRENIEKAQEARRYENRTKRDLYERAKELDIDGRSKMSKHELISALRERR